MKIKRSLSDPLMALKVLLLCEDLTLAERRVGAALIDHRNNRTGRCDPGLETLSRELGIGRRTVIRASAALEKRGLLRKRRYGGYFHRNSYEFNWERFRDLNAAWEKHRESVRRKNAQENLSPCAGQAHHLESDTRTTQTCLSNQSKETYVAAQPQQHTRRDRIFEASKGTREVTRSSLSNSVANEWFHVKTATSRDAARDAAERRWNEALMKQFLSAPDVFGGLMQEIDSELSRATTDAELQKRGSGIHFLLHELDRRARLKAGKVAADKGTVPSGEVSEAGNSNREGLPVRSDFHSLKTKLDSLNSEPKVVGPLEKTSRNSGGGGGWHAGQDGLEVQE